MEKSEKVTMKAFIRSHHDDTGFNPPDCEKYWCKWCGVRSYAQHGSGFLERQVCGQCNNISGEDTRECKVHGQYQVLVKTDGETIGECYSCYKETVRTQRRREGRCELCGTDLGILVRWAGRVQCKTGMCSRPLNDLRLTYFINWPT